jgi:SAM-dependent methyltransferase
MIKDWEKQRDKIADIYSRRVKEHGYSHESVCWGSRNGQQLRFKVLSEIAILDNCSILDVGCGLADFWEYIKKITQNVDYTGIDISSEMIEKAKSQFPSLKLDCIDLLSDATLFQFDYVFASGLFNRLYENQYETMFALIEKLFSLSKYGLAFNSLSGWKKEDFQSDFAPDPYHIIDFCRTLTPWISCRFDYMPHDFTLYLYQDFNGVKR